MFWFWLTQLIAFFIWYFPSSVSPSFKMDHWMMNTFSWLFLCREDMLLHRTRSTESQRRCSFKQKWNTFDGVHACMPFINCFEFGTHVFSHCTEWPNTRGMYARCQKPSSLKGCWYASRPAMRRDGVCASTPRWIQYIVFCKSSLRNWSKNHWGFKRESLILRLVLVGLCVLLFSTLPIQESMFSEGWFLYICFQEWETPESDVWTDRTDSNEITSCYIHAGAHEWLLTVLQDRGRQKTSVARYFKESLNRSVGMCKTLVGLIFNVNAYAASRIWWTFCSCVCWMLKGNSCTYSYQLTVENLTGILLCTFWLPDDPSTHMTFKVTMYA